MENPTLTFLTPTFIAGDKSLVGLVAHELAHSWSGNLVTNATWADIWLNEGVTSYFENRIMEAIYGPKRAAQEAALSFDEMKKAFAEEGRNGPEHAAPSRPERGRARRRARRTSSTTRAPIFLRTMEKIVGRERCDAYLRSYFDRHAFQPMTSARVPGRYARESDQGRHRRSNRSSSSTIGSTSRACRRMSRAPDPAAFADGRQGGRRLRRGRRLAPPACGSWTTAEKLRFLNKLAAEAADGSP